MYQLYPTILSRRIKRFFLGGFQYHANFLDLLGLSTHLNWIDMFVNLQKLRRTDRTFSPINSINHVFIGPNLDSNDEYIRHPNRDIDLFLDQLKATAWSHAERVFRWVETAKFIDTHPSSKPDLALQSSYFPCRIRVNFLELHGRNLFLGHPKVIEHATFGWQPSKMEAAAFLWGSMWVSWSLGPIWMIGQTFSLETSLLKQRKITYVSGKSGMCMSVGFSTVIGWIPQMFVSQLHVFMVCF